MKKAPKKSASKTTLPKAQKKSATKTASPKAQKKSASKKPVPPKAAKKSKPKQTVSDYIADMAGAKFGDLCDYWVGMNDGKATLADLLEDMENAQVVVQGLIEELGEDALLTAEYES